MNVLNNLSLYLGPSQVIICLNLTTSTQIWIRSLAQTAIFQSEFSAYCRDMLVSTSTGTGHTYLIIRLASPLPRASFDFFAFNVYWHGAWLWWPHHWFSWPHLSPAISLSRTLFYIEILLFAPIIKCFSYKDFAAIVLKCTAIYAIIQQCNHYSNCYLKASNV